ncbi:GNAT family N-acetyltransferase [Pseudoroseicyclus aestuarii]|uniref:L-amino acid N-acyltransferase YncA n=1 Tax=Pseudoroseicyclus aestuarii TaxID=1795041 RepID=A0A318SP02_9RHOB|nr:GNAT family N-acetyltransferase [Pseudoroseicyclus aestuarii]PYE82416.1 L-amino acid N-acyltransferase YncA [Pseudoroseicyclus aestuarii]
MRLEQARAEDAPALGALLSDWIDETPWMPRIHTRDEDADFAEHLVETAEVWVLRDAAPQGFLARREEQVAALYLRASARRQGGGALLLERAKEGRDCLRLWTFAANDGARRFYARHGFAEVGGTAGDNDEGLPDIRMEWRR